MLLWRHISIKSNLFTVIFLARNYQKKKLLKKCLNLRKKKTLFLLFLFSFSEYFNFYLNMINYVALSLFSFLINVNPLNKPNKTVR